MQSCNSPPSRGCKKYQVWELLRLVCLQKHSSLYANVKRSRRLLRSKKSEHIEEKRGKTMNEVIVIDYGCKTAYGDAYVNGETSLEDKEIAFFRENHLQNSRLKRFLEAASQVVIGLISARRGLLMNVEMRNRSLFMFSSGFNTFELGPLARSSQVTTICLNPKEPEFLLVGFFVQESLAEDIVNRTLLVEYFTESIQPPRR
ncbi:hypothetical protein DICVIV_03073 [Dictyocaulus viviparus]|uniref:Uncharacterized protein n=1 Tax=Dictyocaulus viviparus TaxID=29172 RepID=A0A0D8Y3J3_DICVI|nr:hypothetical protein DICVIV_03073 [Dictyocaulus viviparus]